MQLRPARRVCRKEYEVIGPWRDARALIDTGAQMNAVRLDKLSDFGGILIPAPPLQVLGVGGSRSCNGLTIFEVQGVGCKPVLLAFLVVKELPRPLLLGQAFLASHAAVVDLRHGLIRIGSTEWPLFGNWRHSPRIEEHLNRNTTIVHCVTTAEDVVTAIAAVKKDFAASDDTAMAKDTSTSSDKSLPSAIPPSLPQSDKDAKDELTKLTMPKLQPAERIVVEELLWRFRSLWKEKPRGLLHCIEHRVRVTDDRPIRTPQRHFTVDERAVMQKELDKMLVDKVVRPSASPHVSEVVMVKKKTGDWRFCIDFRPVNKYTVKDSHPLPRIVDLLRRVGPSRYFAALDLRSGYWQIGMEEASIPLTAFRCCGGLYEFVVMPFGLTNAPATFQRAMEAVLGEFREAGVLVYLDDILVHAVDFQRCLSLLSEVLRRLECAGLTLNLPKSVFFPEHVLYLGHIVGDGIRKPNPGRVEVLSRWTQPSTISELRSLVGLCNHYQDYVAGFSTLLRPVTDLFRNLPPEARKAKSKHPIVWTSDCTDAMNKVLSALQNACLQVPEDLGVRDELLLETDASDYAFGGVLSVRKKDGTWRPIEFLSRKFSDAESRWHTQEREAFAIISALDNWSDYCRGRSIQVHTDHASLQWLLGAKKGKLARWAMRLAEYDLEVHHRRGTSLSHVDYLSRHVEPDMHLPERALYDSVWARMQNESPKLPPSTSSNVPPAMICVAAKSKASSTKKNPRKRNCKEPHALEKTLEEIHPLNLPDITDSGEQVEPTREPEERRAAALQLEDELVENAIQTLPSLRIEISNYPLLIKKYSDLAKAYGTHKRLIPNIALISQCQRDWGWPCNRRGLSTDGNGRIYYKGSL